MVHDMDGATLAVQEVRLMPGQAASLPVTPIRDVTQPIGIDPCWIPSPENQGIAIPSAEVVSTETGQTMLFLNPATTRLSEFVVSPALR
jgi:hypothetical protein